MDFWLSGELYIREVVIEMTILSDVVRLCRFSRLRLESLFSNASQIRNMN